MPGVGVDHRYNRIVGGQNFRMTGKIGAQLKIPAADS